MKINDEIERAFRQGYLQGKKEAEKCGCDIAVGDEIQGLYEKAIVINKYRNNDGGILFDVITTGNANVSITGVWGYDNNLYKTGKHYPIPDILRELRG